MTADEQAFHAAIAAAPDDVAVRGAYADWLDEHDRPEEADFHRAWTADKRAAALAWLAGFASGHFTGYGGYGDDYGPDREYTAEDMIAAGRQWVESLLPGQVWGERTYQHGGQSLQDEFSSESVRVEFWRNWALATGTYVPTETAEDGYVFGCSC